MAQQSAWSKIGTDEGGAFRRKRSEFRDRISDDGSTPFPAEAGRYHLYVQYACPWAHRTLVHRTLLGLEDAVTVDVVSRWMQSDGSWVFDPDEPGATADSLNGFASLQDVYRSADAGFPGVGTVPVLWDKKEGTIVNNESREIIRMLDDTLAPALGTPRPQTLLPPGLERDVDAMIDANYEPVNNGVYKAGFATTQQAHEDAVDALFARLDALEEHLEGRQWLVGDEAEDRPWAQRRDRPDAPGVLTEADVCLWTTLVRFDPVYHTHFKCNVRKVAEYPNLAAFTKALYHVPGVAATVDFDHIRDHYYGSHKSLNPHGIIPRGPDMEAWLTS